MEFGGVQQGLGLLSESCILKVLSELSLPVLGAVGKMHWVGHGATGSVPPALALHGIALGHQAFPAFCPLQLPVC